MKNLLLPTLVMFIALSSCQQLAEKESTKSPNILLIMVDDMGWTDTEPYGGEIQTPNISKLATNGMLFTDFHTSVSCSPTRSMLLSGIDNHLAGLGNMGELLSPNQVGKPGYEGYLNESVISLAEALKEGGYHTYMAGKWHLGHDVTNIPGARGFEKSFSLLNGGASHYADMSGLVEAEAKVRYSLNGKKITELPKDFYSSKSFTDFLIESLREGKDDKPFFAYLAFSAPHDPLQVPEPWMSKYRGTYDKGYEKLREDRVANTKALKLVPKNVNIPEMHEFVPKWESLSKKEKAKEARTMEIFAGMVDNIDYHTGRILDFLNDIEKLDNTIVLFLSDNGSNPWVNTQYPGNEDGVYLQGFDNSLENIGNPTSHIAYGIGWASAASGPLDYFKMTVGEGGIRTPLIIAGPGIPKGERHNNFAYVTDIMPTLLEMAGVVHPKTYKGKEILPMKGKSMVPVFSGERQSVYAIDDYVGGEMGTGRWMRKGNLKASRVPNPYGNDVWKLYDVSVDPGETTDISSEKPETLKDLIQAWENYAKEVGVVLAE